ncbi:PP2C family protein-serine/threonine phosphatase [Actinacidiphila paucisporea]|uniref:Stage II sporulation protein E (SpoIIE) n=1 Tax=Actinacidiphila paucisporea TaxID=310782 RepID=A0A1M6YPC1_9ACTN|nr:PP2C family protein-serine/threonine phosphatase [Actinacidiphila paucisporea]SHL19869.1 Stage II sporulation protein E (SpoIIE) [Actinacidiphila paucisporea]
MTVALPLAIIALISLADMMSSAAIHLGPLVALAPALTAAFAGPRTTALVGLVAVGAQELVDGFNGESMTNHIAQLAALVALCTAMVATSYVREHRNWQLTRLRSVADAAQRCILRPPPNRIGPLRLGWLYLAAEDEARIGGDLFATARGSDPSTRVIMGDVRGKGVAAIGEVSVVLGAFREGAHRCRTLPDLVDALEESVSRDIEEVADVETDLGEHFVTALMLEIPDQDPFAEVINCGHPPPLLIHHNHVTTLDFEHASPPLGLGGLPAAAQQTDSIPFAPGDILLLYTDGVIEARSPSGEFYPLAERLGSFSGSSPDALLRQIQSDLISHAGKEPADDVALLAIQRLPAGKHHVYEAHR